MCVCVRMCVCVFVIQLCQTLCDPMECSLPGSSVHGIPQVRILEWVAIPFSGGSSWPGVTPGSPALQADSIIWAPGKRHICVCCCCCAQTCPWTAARQAPPWVGFSKQEYWSGLPCPPPGNLPNPGIEPRSPTLQADSLPSEPPGKPAINIQNTIYYNLHTYIYVVVDQWILQ